MRLVGMLLFIAFFSYSCSANLIQSVNSNNQKNGYWVNMEDSSKVVLNQYKNGIKNGHYYVYRNNGSLALKGKYRNGIKHGKFQQFDSLGVKTGYRIYRNDSIVKLKIMQPSW